MLSRLVDAILALGPVALVTLVPLLVSPVICACAIFSQVWLWLFGDDDAKARLDTPRADRPYCIIVGCGFSGLCMAYKCKLHGIPFIVVEKNKQVGGTWHLNTYPGTPCSHFHSYAYSQFSTTH